MAEFRHRQVYEWELHSDGDRLVTDRWDSVVRLWTVAEAQLVAEKEFGPDYRTQLTGGTDGVNYLWDLSTATHMEDIDVPELAQYALLCSSG